MKSFLRYALVSITLLIGFAASPASALDCTLGTPAHTCYAIATGNWGSTGTWSYTSSGATCICTPATGENIVFDAGSNGKTFTMEAAYSLNSLVATGSTTATWVHNAFTLTITGDTFTLASTMTYSPAAARLVLFTPASGHTVAVTTAASATNKGFGSVTLTGADATATLAPQDAFVANISNASNALVNAGIFDASVNNVAVTVSTFNSPNGSARTIRMGSGTWSITQDSSTNDSWNVGTTATLTAGASTLAFTAASPLTSVKFVTGGLSYNVVTADIGSRYPLQFSGTGATIATLNLGASIRAITLNSNDTYTITNALNWAGSSTQPVLIYRSTAFSIPTLAIASGSTTSWVSFAGVTFTGSGTKLVATNCLDFGGNVFNSGTCTAPSAGGGGGHIIGG